MKRKIGTIYNKPIVTGDKNLVTRNEIHESILKGGGTVDSGSSDGKEYDDLHTFLYYDDRLISIGNSEVPLCALLAGMMSQLAKSCPNINTIIKMSNTEDVFGINYGNYLPLDCLLGGSGYESILFSFKGISIPKYVFPEFMLDVSGASITFENDKTHIFDLIGIILGESNAAFLKTLPTITREEFFDLLK